MATPIAHKGSTPGAKVLALTALDFFLDPEKVRAAWSYFNDVQTKGMKYTPFIRESDSPAVHLNTERMGEFREGDAEVLLRPVEIRLVPRAARHRVPDGAVNGAVRARVTGPFAASQSVISNFLMMSGSPS